MSKTERPLDRLAPDGFVEEIDARTGRNIDTVDDALEYAHRQLPSSTPEEKMPTCPECGSVRVTRKPGMFTDAPQRVDTVFKCTNCFAHIDERAPPKAEAPDDDFENTDETMTDTNTDSDPFEWVDDDSGRFEWIDTDELKRPAERIRARPPQSDDELEEFVLRLYRPWDRRDGDPSYYDIAALIRYTPTWVGKRVREWKDRREQAGAWPSVDAGAGTRTAATDGGER